MTLVLLVAAGLLLQTLYKLRYADLGLRPDGLLTLRTALPLDRYGEHARRAAFYDRVLAGVEQLPGVVAAGYSTSIPLEWKGGTSQFAVEGQAPDTRLPYDANHRQISAGYLQTLGVPLRQGRHFRPADDARAQMVVIVNETLARQYWPGKDPVGSRIAVDPPNASAPGRYLTWRTVVGVVGDVRQMGLDEAPRPEDGPALIASSARRSGSPLETSWSRQRAIPKASPPPSSSGSTTWIRPRPSRTSAPSTT